MLCHSRTRGYSLKLRRWLDFNSDDICDISWREDAFSKLVLPDDQKNLILAISETQIKGSSFDDIISGKGRGIVCLLSGPPSFGMTLTAEAVAEHLRVPLHTLSWGDLGSNASDLDDKLTSILDPVTRWNGILLIDECDVFLEARSATTDLDRNKAVSIFLRTLEYYAGILFMTTNRIGNIDPAFQSRIHVALEYGALDFTSREAVWRNFISEDMDFSDEDLKKLAKLELNGRHIKNVIKTAGLLAARHKKPPGKSFVDTVLAIEDRRAKIGCDASL
ncbi:P-loop containing nucleoside triphosphate hydrolase protein [Colletotrichum cereale]|nr:P-loop containing nucleoside triphosphate hydrolase protein [Colletotrichum cereale]